MRRERLQGDLEGAARERLQQAAGRARSEVARADGVLRDAMSEVLDRAQVRAAMP